MDSDQIVIVGVSRLFLMIRHHYLCFVLSYETGVNILLLHHPGLVPSSGVAGIAD